MDNLTSGTGRLAPAPTKRVSEHKRWAPLTSHGTQTVTVRIRHLRIQGHLSDTPCAPLRSHRSPLGPSLSSTSKLEKMAPSGKQAGLLLLVSTLRASRASHAHSSGICRTHLTHPWALPSAPSYHIQPDHFNPPASDMLDANTRHRTLNGTSGLREAVTISLP